MEGEDERGEFMEKINPGNFQKLRKLRIIRIQD
jgi:hypothetical protein